MMIRSEISADIGAISQLTADAFAPHPFSDGSEPDIINRLRDAGALSFSLVAEEDGVILGHVALSPVTIAECRDWYGLGPIAVKPARQKQGIGTLLMKTALAELETIGSGGCVLVGNPDYYGRFGFVSSGALTFSDTPVKYVQHVRLRGAEPKGEVGYHGAFGGV